MFLGGPRPDRGLDPFAQLGIVAGDRAARVVATGRSPVALGVVALDLLLAVDRRRACCASGSGSGPGRLVHWSAYARWPLAVLHRDHGRHAMRTATVDARDRRRLRAIGGRRRHRGWRVTAGTPNRGAAPQVVLAARDGSDATPAGGARRDDRLTDRVSSPDPSTGVGRRTLRGPPSPARARCRCCGNGAGHPGVAGGAGLLGRGGAASRSARKWASVADQRGDGGDAVVLGRTGAEGEPLSAKDRVLMTARPHLVLEAPSWRPTPSGHGGSCCTSARSTGTRSTRRAGGGGAACRSAARAPRGSPWTSSCTPRTYVAGEESAAVHCVERGRSPADHDAAAAVRARRRRPADARAERREPRPRGADRTVRVTAWYREAGRGETRGTALFTVSGAPQSGVVELELGHEHRRGRGRRRRRGAGGPVLLGGYFGGWVAGAEALARATRSDRAPAGRGAPSGAASSRSSTSARAASASRPRSSTTWPARAPPNAARACSACGPSPTRRHGIATAMPATTTSAGSPAGRETLTGRGACRHPDGAVGLVRSALRVFDAEFARHQRNRRCITQRAPHGAPPDVGERLGAAVPARISSWASTASVCDGYGICAELLPEMIELDDWGYPIISPWPVPPFLEDHARRAVDTCPVLALRLIAVPRARSMRRKGRDGRRQADAVRVLVAEDDEGLRDVLVLGLADAGYHVDAVDRGDDAIDQLKWYEYDVAVIDWRMPGAEGIDVVALGTPPRPPDGAPDADRPRHAGRPDPGPRHRAPTTTSSSPSTSGSCSPASERSSDVRAASTRRSSSAGRLTLDPVTRQVSVDGARGVADRHRVPDPRAAAAPLAGRRRSQGDRRACLGRRDRSARLERHRRPAEPAAGEAAGRRRPDRDRARRGVPAGGLA